MGCGLRSDFGGLCCFFHGLPGSAIFEVREVAVGNVLVDFLRGLVRYFKDRGSL